MPPKVPATIRRGLKRSVPTSEKNPERPSKTCVAASPGSHARVCCCRRRRRSFLACFFCRRRLTPSFCRAPWLLSPAADVEPLSQLEGWTVTGGTRLEALECARRRFASQGVAHMRAMKTCVLPMLSAPLVLGSQLGQGSSKTVFACELASTEAVPAVSSSSASLSSPSSSSPPPTHHPESSPTVAPAPLGFPSSVASAAAFACGDEYARYFYHVTTTVMRGCGVTPCLAYDSKSKHIVTERVCDRTTLVGRLGTFDDDALIRAALVLLCTFATVSSVLGAWTPDWSTERNWGLRRAERPTAIEFPELAAQLALPVIRISVPAGEWVPTLYDLSYDRSLACKFIVHVRAGLEYEDDYAPAVRAERAARDLFRETFGGLEHASIPGAAVSNDAKGDDVSGGGGGGGGGDGANDTKAEMKTKPASSPPSTPSYLGVWRLACMEEVVGSGSANPDHAFPYVHELAKNGALAAALRARFDAALRVAQSRKENQIGAVGVFLGEHIPELTLDLSGSGSDSSSSTTIPTVPLSRFAIAGLALA